MKKIIKLFLISNSNIIAILNIVFLITKKEIFVLFNIYKIELNYLVLLIKHETIIIKMVVTKIIKEVRNIINLNEDSGIENLKDHLLMNTKN